MWGKCIVVVMVTTVWKDAISYPSDDTYNREVFNPYVFEEELGHFHRRYVGCFEPVLSDPELPVNSTFLSDNTIQGCINHCSSSGWTYVGLQYGFQCLCGDMFYSVHSSSCRDKHLAVCSGDPSQICGGDDGAIDFYINEWSSCPCGVGRACIYSLACMTNCRSGFHRQNTQDSGDFECVPGCDPGYYGPDCGIENPKCVEGLVHPINGYCLIGCSQGYGPFCDIAPIPPEDVKPAGACSLCLNCEAGECGRGWVDAYKTCSYYWPDKGFTCTKGCVPGRWGTLCARSCSEKCQNNTCDGESGACDMCVEGWYGERCDIECPAFCKGAGRACQQQTGYCKEGCTSDYFSDAHCEECILGMYGSACHMRCPLNCKKEMSCDKLTGLCINGCDKSYFGYRCMLPCSKCRDGACEQSLGICEPCLPGFYGVLCNETCPQICAEVCKDSCPRMCGVCAEYSGFRHDKGSENKFTPTSKPRSLSAMQQVFNNPGLWAAIGILVLVAFIVGTLKFDHELKKKKQVNDKKEEKGFKLPFLNNATKYKVVKSTNKDQLTTSVTKLERIHSTSTASTSARHMAAPEQTSKGDGSNLAVVNPPAPRSLKSEGNNSLNTASASTRNLAGASSLNTHSTSTRNMGGGASQSQMNIPGDSNLTCLRKSSFILSKTNLAPTPSQRFLSEPSRMCADGGIHWTVDASEGSKNLITPIPSTAMRYIATPSKQNLAGGSHFSVNVAESTEVQEFERSDSLRSIRPMRLAGGPSVMSTVIVEDDLCVDSDLALYSKYKVSKQAMH